MKKFNITRVNVKTAIRLIAYGPEGIGKSTLASQFPNPLFIDTEGGTSQLDVARYPKPETWQDLLDMIDSVIDDPNICRTLVIDTADRAEQLLTETLLTEGKCDSIEKYGGGYGKGYTALQERMQKDFLRRLDKVIAKGVNVTILAHAAMRKFESPEDPPYDRWELKTSKKVSPILKEWTDILTFINYKNNIVEDGNGKAKVKGTAKRVMYFNHRPTYDAKNRYGLEDGQPLGFEALRAVYEGETPAVPQPSALEIDAPDDGIVEGNDLFSDIRQVLIQKLNDAGISTEKFEAWAVATFRLQPGTHYDSLSDLSAQAMVDHIDTLIKEIEKGGEK